MTSVRIVAWSAKKAPDGTLPLYLAIRHKNQRAKLALPVRLNLRLTEVLQKVESLSRMHFLRIDPFRLTGSKRPSLRRLKAGRVPSQILMDQVLAVRH